MSEVAADILLRIKVDVSNLRAISQLETATSRVEAVRNRTATSAARLAREESALEAQQNRTRVAADKAKVSKLSVKKANEQVALAVARNAAQQQKLVTIQNQTGVSAQKLARAENDAKKSAVALTKAETQLASAIAQTKKHTTQATTAKHINTKARNTAKASAIGLKIQEEKLAQAIARTSTEQMRAKVYMDRLREAADKQRDAFAKSIPSFNIFKRVLGGLLGHLTKVERAMDAVFRAATHMQTMGRQLLGFGQKVGGMLVDMAQQWGDFEFMLNRAAGAADIFSTTDEMYGKLKESIYDAAQELRLFDPTEIAQATYFWQSTTGKAIKTEEDLAEAMTNVREAMKTAAMTQSSYEQVIKGSFSIMKQYGMEMTDIPDILHSLFQETRRTALEFPDLIQSFKMMGPMAKSLKIPFEDIAKTLGILGDLGLRGSRTGQGLGQFLTQMVRPTPKIVKAVNQLFHETLGVHDAMNNLIFPKGEFVGMEKFVTLLANATKDLTTQQKMNYITTITGTQNSARMIIPLIDAQIAAIKRGESIYQDAKYSFAGATEAFGKSWDILAKSWQGVIGGLKQTLMPVLLTIGEIIAKNLSPVIEEFSGMLDEMRPIFTEIAETVAGSLAPVIKWFKSMVKQAAEWLKSNPDMAKQIAVWLTFGTVIATVVGAILLLLGVLAFLVTNLILVGVGVLPVLAVLGGIAAVIIGNVEGIRDALVGFAESFAGLVLRLLGGNEEAAASWDTLIEKGKELVTGVLEKVSAALETVSDWMDSLSDEDVQRIKDVIIAIVGLVVLDKVLGLAITFLGLFKNIGVVLGFLGTTTFPVLTNVVVALFGGLRLLWAILLPIGTFLVTFVAAFLGVPVAVAAGIVAAIAAVVAAVVAFIFNIGGFRDWVIGVWNTVTTKIGEIVSGIFTWIGEVVGGIAKAITDGFNAFVAWLGSLPGTIAEWLGQVFTAIGTWIGEVVAAIAGFITDILTKIGNFLTDLKDNWGKYLGRIVGTVIGKLALIIGAVVTFIADFIGKVLTFLEELPGKFATWLGEVLTAIGTWISDTIEAVSQFVTDFANNVGTFFLELPGKVGAWLAEVWTTLSTWFTDTITDVGEWAGDMINDIVQFFIDLPGKISTALDTVTTAIKDFFTNLVKTGGEIWNKLLEVGSQIVDGILKGIGDLAGYFQKQVGDFFEGIIEGVKDTLGIESPSKVFAKIGEQMISGLAVGINKTDDAIAAVTKTTSAMVSAAYTGLSPFSTEISALSGGFNYSRTSESTKQIDLNVNVTSGDGSVSNLDMASLANLITGSEMVRALEMMATVS